MLTREIALKIVKEFISRIQSEGTDIRTAVLFGSFVTDSQDDWSDIDLALVSDDFTGFGYEDKRSFARINAKNPFSLIHTKTYPSKYFEQGDPFIDQIKKTGIVIYQKT